MVLDIYIFIVLWLIDWLLDNRSLHCIENLHSLENGTAILYNQMNHPQHLDFTVLFVLDILTIYRDEEVLKHGPIKKEAYLIKYYDFFIWLFLNSISFHQSNEMGFIHFLIHKVRVTFSHKKIIVVGRMDFSMGNSRC